MLPNHKLLKTAYTAFNDRDIDAVLRLMSPAVDWPNVIENIRIHGHAQVREYWTGQFAILDPQIEPTGFTDEDDRTVVDVHQVVRDLSGNVLVDKVLQHVYTINNGLIERMDIRQP